ncbi:MAG: mechanosensitive ion channel [Bacteroidales bacterium]|nr:mechanosensitive ion channel [Bacteroidales bacterium]
MANDSTLVATILQNLNSVKEKTPSEIMSELWSQLLNFGLKVLMALIIYMIGAWIIRRVKQIMKKFFEKKGTEASLAGFLISVANISMIVLLVVIVVGILGINTTSFAALLASGGLAVGMALSGTLQNFAGGIMILAFKPFKVGDYINVGGNQGTVESISITSTKLLTPDNKVVVMPNGSLSSSNIDNYSCSGTRRVEWRLSLEYGTDFEAVKESVVGFFNDDTRVLREIEPVCFLAEMGESAIILSVRVWVKSENYWDIYFGYNELFYKELPKRGFNFAYPHLTVNMQK